MGRRFSIDDWFSGGCLATMIAVTVGLPALAIIIVILWLWEQIERGGRQPD